MTSKSPAHVRAGLAHQTKRGSLTEAGRQRLRETAIKHKPWRFSTGPRTPEGKARSAANGLKRQKGEKSVRQMRGELADIQALVKQMRDVRDQASSDDPTPAPRTAERWTAR